MNIQVTIKNVYGNELIYPECTTAHLLAEFRGQKTFTERDISMIKKLGYTIDITQAKSLLGERMKS